MNSVDRIPYGEETDEEAGGRPLYIARDAERCPDCQSERGELHVPGCDVEQCPDCGLQLIGCDHADEWIGEGRGDG